MTRLMKDWLRRRIDAEPDGLEVEAGTNARPIADLVAELREPYTQDQSRRVGLEHQAANALAGMQHAIAMAWESNRERDKECERLRARAERAEEDNRRYDKHLYACNERLEAAEAAVAEAAEVIAPFAKSARSFPASIYGTDRVHMRADLAPRLIDLRRAQEWFDKHGGS